MGKKGCFLDYFWSSKGSEVISSPPLMAFSTRMGKTYFIVVFWEFDS